MTKIPQTGLVFGVKIASIDMEGVIKSIEHVVHGSWQKAPQRRPFWIVTAYSETLLRTLQDPSFGQVIGQADMVVPDGIAVLMAQDYLARRSGNPIMDIWVGLTTGGRGSLGKLGERVVGVDLVKRLLEKKEFKILLVGGWNGVADRLANRYKAEFLAGPQDILALTSVENDKLVTDINAKHADVVLVAFGQFKQEAWIAQNVDRLKAKVIIGVGSSFDELMREGVWAHPTPTWISKMGLKWLWRAMNDPKHWRRVWRAVVVFPWRVFTSR